MKLDTNYSTENSCENCENCELPINKTVIPGKKFPKFSVTVKNPILPTYYRIERIKRLEQLVRVVSSKY